MDNNIPAYSDAFKHPQPWYGVKSVLFDPQNELYEERVVLFKADTSKEALQKAKEEAEEYASNLDMIDTGFRESFHIFEENVEDAVEVYSSMRYSNLPAEKYVEKFFLTGDEIELSQKGSE